MENAFGYFSKWAKSNRRAFRRWLALHYQPWIRRSHDLRVKGDYVFDVEQLVETNKFQVLQGELELHKIGLSWITDSSIMTIR